MRLTSSGFIRITYIIASSLLLSITVVIYTGNWGDKSSSKRPSIFVERIRPRLETVHSPEVLSNTIAIPVERIKDQKPPVNHFLADWPPPIQKPRCKNDYNIKVSEISVIIYLRNNYNSLPLQTFMSIQEFTAEAGVKIADVVIAHVFNVDHTSSHLTVINEIKAVAQGTVLVSNVSSSSEYKAKLGAVQLAKSHQVFVIDDTHIVNHGYIRPLIHLLELNPESLIYPHTDTLLPDRIYLSGNDVSQNADVQIWQEISTVLYKVEPNLAMSRKESPNVREETTPEFFTSAGLSGQVFFGMKSHTEFILSRMVSDEPAELSVLSWLCGRGILATKCSSVVQAYNNPMAPQAMDKESLQKIYNNFEHANLPACKNINWYFQDFLQQYQW